MGELRWEPVEERVAEDDCAVRERMRMLRVIFNAVTVLSTLLCLALVALRWNCIEQQASPGFPQFVGLGRKFYPNTGEAIFIDISPAFAFIFGTVPAIWVALKMKERRTAPAGHCPYCWYDVRATRECCPECGKIQPARFD